MIDFHFVKTKKLSTNSYAKWIKEIVVNEGKNVGDIAFIFCNDDYLQTKNIQFLNHNTLTDVITFDYCQETTISGDIFISIERVKENSDVYKTTFLNELSRVMAHGLLHLLGYNDKTKKEIELMRLKENYYLSIK